MNEDTAKEKKSFEERVRTVFAELKSLKRYDQLINASIPLDGDSGYLVCVSEFHINDDVVISLLSKWREEATTFHSKFEVTHEGTRKWLRSLLLDIPDKILFLVLDRYGRPVGHLGFAGACNPERIFELDNVIRGEHGCAPGIMEKATIALFQWARDTFSPRKFFLRTLDDNSHAINFYSKLGFREQDKQPLRRINHEAGFNHVPVESGDNELPDKFFIGMSLEAAQ